MKTCIIIIGFFLAIMIILCSSLPILVLLEWQQRLQAGELCVMSQAVPPLPALQWHGTRWRLSWWQGLRFWCFNRCDLRGLMNRMASHGLMIWWLSGWVRYDPKHAGTNWSPYENCENLVGLIVLVHELSSSRIQATRCPKCTTGPFLRLFFLSSLGSKTEALQVSTWTSEHRGCLDVTGAPLVAEAPLPSELQKVLAALVEVDHWTSTSWSQVGGSYASNGFQWYYLGPAISKLQIRSWWRRRDLCGVIYVSFLSSVHIRATKAQRHLKNL